MVPTSIQACMCIILACSVYLAWRLVPVDVQVVLLVLCCSAAVAARSTVSEVRNNGLLCYCPEWISDMLLRQSLLHFLSDAKLLKELRKYAPLFLGLSPNELRLYLAGAPVEFRDNLTRPGMLHLFPIAWQQWLHPASAREAALEAEAAASALVPPAPSSPPKPAAAGIAGLLASMFSPRTAVQEQPAVGAFQALPTDALQGGGEVAAEADSVGTPGAAFDQVMSRILAMRAMSGVTDALSTVDRLRPALLATAAGGTALLLLRFALHRRSRSAFLRSTVAIATGGATVSVTLIWALLALHSWARRRAASAKQQLHASAGLPPDSPIATQPRVAQTQPAAANRQEPAPAAAPASAYASTRPAGGGVRRQLRFE